MLVGNVSTFNRCLVRFLGGTTLCGERNNWLKGGALNNFYAGEATVISGASIADKNAFPVGYLHPYSWVPPIKPGGLASYNAINGSGIVSVANLAGGRNAEGSIVGTSDFTATMSALAGMLSTISGIGEITSADLQALSEITATIPGLGDLSGSLIALAEISASLDGTGIISNAAAGLILSAVATLTGSGEISDASLSLLVSIAADLTGSASLTGSVVGAGNAQTAIGGGSDLTGSLGALAGAIATLAGTGLASGTLDAKGWMEAEISSNSELSPENLANAVLAAQVEGSLTMAELLRVLMSLAAGETEIQNNAGEITVIFKSQDGTKQRITAVMAGSERTQVTVDGSE